MSGFRQKFKSDVAADKALKRVSLDLVQQLNLFDTTLHLHAMNGLTLLEAEKLGNCYSTELERKQYLVTTVLPSKGAYKGMRLLRRALKQSEQHEICNTLEKAYEDAVDAVIARKLGLTQASEVKNETVSSRYPVQATGSDLCDSITSLMFSGTDLLQQDGRGDKKKHTRTHLGWPTSSSTGVTSSSSSSSDDDNDDAVSLDSPVQQQTLVDIKFQIPLSRDSSKTVVAVTSLPHRQRSSHISYQSNPYKSNFKPPRQAVSVAINVVPDNSSANDHDKTPAIAVNHASDTLRSVDRLVCDSPVMKLVFVGDVATGKTSLLERYVNNKFTIASEPTTLIDFKSIELNCYDVKYKLHLWDTAGQERFKAITNAYYREAVGGFVVYDVTQTASFEHCLLWKRQIDDVVHLSNGDPIPIVLIANKADCGQLNGEQFSKEHGFAGYFETSAKTGSGINEAIHFMVKKIHQLSCAHQEPIVRTLSRDRAMSIKLQFIKDDDNSSGRKCCRQH